MDDNNKILPDFLNILRDKFGDQMNLFHIPPPIFLAMKGEILDLDQSMGSLTAKFPILDCYLNPYGMMQGGIIAAAVDNTLGPLSIIVAPVNVTRKLEMKYSQAAKPEMEYIVVKAKLLERNDPKLFFEAIVRSPDGRRLATGKALHWII